MHIVLIAIGLLCVWSCYTVFGPKGFLKLVLGITLGLVLLTTAVVGSALMWDAKQKRVAEVNPYDQFDEPEKKPNYFDKYDDEPDSPPRAAKPTKKPNYFDKYDEPTKK